MFVRLFISGFCLRFDFYCLGSCPHPAQGSMHQMRMWCFICLCQRVNMQIIFFKNHCTWKQTLWWMHYFPEFYVPAFEMINIMFNHVSPVSQNDMKMNEMRISGTESKIRTSYFASNYGPIINSWQDPSFSGWTWEGLIVHQQHRGREMESVGPALNMLSHLGLDPDHNRAARFSFVSLAETARNVRNCQARSTEQHLPTELFVKW